MPFQPNPDARRIAVRRLANSLGDIALDIEGEGKKQLYKGHGVVTGTLRRSIHVAEPGYNWPADDTAPSSGSPELGGQVVAPEESASRLTLVVGSGLVYALAIHQGWQAGQSGLRGSFAGYHYLTNAIDIVRPRVPEHIARHRND